MGERGASVKVLLAVVAVITASFQTFADHNPPTCTLSAANVALGPFCNSNATGSLLGQPVVAGQTVYYQAALSHNSDLLCGFEGGQIFITTPDGVTTDATPAGGIPLVCGSPSCSPAGVPIVFSKIVSYVVRAQDINVNQQFFQPCATNSVQATARYTGGHSHCDAEDQCDPSAATSVCNPSRVIGFVVEKAVACTFGQACDAGLTYNATASGISTNGNGARFCFRFIYRNTNSAPLVVTNVVDSTLGQLVGPTNTFALAPGAAVTNFSGPQALSGTITNTVTAQAAQTAQSCFLTTVVAQASATATVVPASIAVTKVCDGEPFGLGQPIRFRGTVSNTGSATLTGVSVTDDQAGTLLTGITLMPGASTNYNGSYTPTGNPCGPFTDTVTAAGTASGSCPVNISNTASTTCSVITAPAIAVTKLCDGAPFGFGQPIQFRGTVSNTGNVTLTGVTVIDNQAGPVLTGVTLAPGASTNYSGSYTPAEASCGPLSDTVTASGLDQCTRSNITAEATVMCNVVTAPAISVTKQCDGAPFAVGQPVRFRGTVCNTGNITLTSVRVRDDQAGIILFGVTLAPGDCTNYSGSFANTQCGFITNIVTATGFDLCTASPVSSLATAVCEVVCQPPSPMICITKQVACVISNDTCGTFSGSATGVSSINPQGVTNLPAFCYTITATNCGMEDLQNVSVTDTVYGVLATNITLFRVGASTNFTFMAELSGDTTNRVTALGTGAVSMAGVSASATATALVKQASIACTKFANPMSLTCGSGPQPVTYSVSVFNTGEADLTNVTITDSLLGGEECVLPPPFSLRANGSTNIVLCTIQVDCGRPGTLTNTCSSPLLGQAAGCTVLQLGGGFQVSMTGPPGGIQGDVCIGPRSKLSMSGSQFITGCVRLAPGATFSRSGSTTIGCLQMNQDISGEISAAIAASQNAAALPCTRHLSNFTSGTTITGDAGQNVLCLDKVVLGGGVVTLTGPPGASFVINVTGKFALSGGAQIRVAGGLQPRDVLYNIIGTGEQVAFSGGGGGMNCCKAVVDGTLIALDRNIALSPGLVNGQLVGGRNISIVSGASVRCPPSPPECAPVVNTLTVVGEVAEVQSNLLACVRDRHGNPITVGSECSVTVACGTTNPPPPTCPVTTISANFNGTAIPAGAFIWFNQIVSVSGRDTNPANVHFTDASISFTANGVAYNLTMPESLIVFSASATQATTTFDTANNRWVTTVPVSYSGNVFVGGVPFQVPAGGFAGGISPVTWSGIFSSDVAGLGFSWKWAAAVYSQFSSNNNALGVKPIDGSQLNSYSNADHAGTPENYKNFVTGGARGGGGSNFTGSYSGTANVTCP